MSRSDKSRVWENHRPSETDIDLLRRRSVYGHRVIIDSIEPIETLKAKFGTIPHAILVARQYQFCIDYENGVQYFIPQYGLEREMKEWLRDILFRIVYDLTREIDFARHVSEGLIQAGYVHGDIRTGAPWDALDDEDDDVRDDEEEDGGDDEELEVRSCRSDSSNPFAPIHRW